MDPDPAEWSAAAAVLRTGGTAVPPNGYGPPRRHARVAAPDRRADRRQLGRAGNGLRADSSAALALLVAAGMQQWLHDTFVHTSWPSSRRHSDHPLWLVADPAGSLLWRCPTDGGTFPLGSLAPPPPESEGDEDGLLRAAAAAAAVRAVVRR